MPTQHVICIIHGGHIVLVSLILYRPTVTVRTMKDSVMLLD